MLRTQSGQRTLLAGGVFAWLSCQALARKNGCTSPQTLFARCKLFSMSSARGMSIGWGCQLSQSKPPGQPTWNWQTDLQH